MTGNLKPTEKKNKIDLIRDPKTKKIKRKFDNLGGNFNDYSYDIKFNGV